MSKLVDTIPLPSGLRSLSIEELAQVTAELRAELIETVSASGGHFASSLGAAEITVALHHVFETPHDRIVWDVGHQGYIHKMVTGRRAQMHTIRQKDGISGFLRREESEFDCFGAGHAGTSISAAVGMSEALARTAPERRAIAVIGDGSITAGMAFEALNHAGSLGKNLIVVLNDNEMSISPNVGAMSWLFSKAVTSHCSTKARATFKRLFKSGYVPKFVYDALDRAEEAAQGFFASPAMLFESFGFRYIGPVDGHNLKDLVDALKRAREQDVPVLVHAYTFKGKGYEPAEEDPLKWHGVTPFNPQKAAFLSVNSPAKKLPSFTQVFADSLIDIAGKNPKVVAITAAMATGTGLDRFQEVFPDRFYDVAICEQHAVTFAAGLACEGFHPVCAIYSTFLQRAYDQVVHDVCIQNLPVVFAMDRAGVVGNDGHTHQGVFDISYLRCLPNISILAPKDELELRQMLNAALAHSGPVAIRYPRGNAIGVAIDAAALQRQIPIGKGEIVRTGSGDLLMLAIGPLVYTALMVADELEKLFGIVVTVINARSIKPLDEALLSAELPRHRAICTIEDHALSGGFGAAVLEMVNDRGLLLQAPIKRFGVPDLFVDHASQGEQYQALGYGKEQILEWARACLSARAVKLVANL
jgi:1-deoxy-D-xylulose-5-phosphate synthase